MGSPFGTCYARANRIIRERRARVPCCFDDRAIANLKDRQAPRTNGPDAREPRALLRVRRGNNFRDDRMQTFSDSTTNARSISSQISIGRLTPRRWQCVISRVRRRKITYLGSTIHPLDVLRRRCLTGHVESPIGACCRWVRETLCLLAACRDYGTDGESVCERATQPREAK